MDPDGSCLTVDTDMLPGKIAAVSVPCTCGELFQGLLDGEPCLVSCPIARYSTAQVGGPGVSTRLPRKAAAALKILLPEENEQIPVWLDSPLPAGRGFGASTADIGAVLFAAAAAYGMELTGEQAARLAVAIEPTDSTLFPGLALFDHRQGRFFHPLGDAPALTLLILDPGGCVDSETFNRQDLLPALARLAREQRSAFDQLQTGITAGDLEAIGAAASRSAQLHQSILFNPLLETAAALAVEVGALGICRAHSGTVLGLLFDPKQWDAPRVTRAAAARIPSGVQTFSAALVGGGPRDAGLQTPAPLIHAQLAS
jgi:L-threonine kinase